MANSLFDKYYAMSVAEIFYERMEKKGKSLEDVAKNTNVKYNTLFRYMNGSRQIPIDLFKDICTYLDLDFADTFRKVNKAAVNKTIHDMGDNA